MTQNNDAADRAQEFNDVSVETTVAANESFAQDWLDAEEKERAEQTNAAPRSRVVATLPDWTTFGATTDEKKGRDWRGLWRSGALRTTGVALAAFGLGAWCASGNWRDESSADDASAVAVVDSENNGENGVSTENALGSLNDDALASIDSSTLRSVPNSTSVGFAPETSAGSFGAALPAAAVEGGGEENADVALNADVSTNGDAENGNWAASQAPTANASWTTDSNWRRGVDFQREIEAPSDATASVDRFPTWDDLGANAPTVADILNAPLETTASVETNAPIAENASANVAVANRFSLNENGAAAQNSTAFAEPSVGGNNDFAVYSGNAGYPGGGATNLNGGAPQFAGNSQNSGYNQTNGFGNFAGSPTAASNAAASVSASTAPNYASVAPVSPTPNYASNAPVSPTPNYVAVAPSAPTQENASNAVAEPPRAMVAQVPNENAPVAAPNVPTPNPNLRW